MFISYLVATCGFLKGAALGAAVATVLCRNGLPRGMTAMSRGWSMGPGGER